MHREDTYGSRVGNFPEARPVLREVTETLCTAGTVDFGRTGSAQYVGINYVYWTIVL